MKRRILAILLVAVLLMTAAMFVACDDSQQDETEKDKGNAEPLGDDGKVKESARLFAGQFAAKALDLGGNSAISPASIFMTLALAAACSQGETQAEIVELLDIDMQTLESGIGAMASALSRETKTSLLEVANSVWTDKNIDPIEEKLEALTEKYSADIFSEDFRNDNAGANGALREYVLEKSRGLIDHNFELAEETLFVMMNVLYLKDNWGGNDLRFTEEDHVFKGTDGDTAVKLLQGDYKLGKAYDGDGYSSFFTETIAGYRVTFILPDDGESPQSVMSAQTISDAISREYVEVDSGKNERYYTRCLFPEFSAGFDDDLSKILREDFGVSALFDDEKCDLSPLLGENNGGYPDVRCPVMQHIVKFNADEKGIEGAAVTYSPATSESAPEEELVYADFVVDRAFGFVVSYDGYALFVGSVGSLD